MAAGNRKKYTENSKEHEQNDGLRIYNEMSPHGGLPQSTTGKNRGGGLLTPLQTFFQGLSCP